MEIITHTEYINNKQQIKSTIYQPIQYGTIRIRVMENKRKINDPYSNNDLVLNNYPNHTGGIGRELL